MLLLISAPLETSQNFHTSIHIVEGNEDKNFECHYFYFIHFNTKVKEKYIYFLQPTQRTKKKKQQKRLNKILYLFESTKKKKKIKTK